MQGSKTVHTGPRVKSEGAIPGVHLDLMLVWQASPPDPFFDSQVYYSLTSFKMGGASIAAFSRIFFILNWTTGQGAQGCLHQEWGAFSSQGPKSLAPPTLAGQLEEPPVSPLASL